MNFMLVFMVLIFSTFAQATTIKDPNLISLHKTHIVGLNSSESRYIRADISQDIDGVTRMTGYQVSCIANNKKLFGSFAWKDSVKHSYFYHVTYSICPSADAGNSKHNLCDPIISIDINATANKINQADVDLPRYQLDLSPFTGSHSSCTDSDTVDISYIKQIKATR